MKKLEFLASLPGESRVWVRWDKPLGRTGSAAYQALLDILEELHGVESVTLGRYTADVRVADHIISERLLAQDIVEHLTDALLVGELGTALHAEYPDMELSAHFAPEPPSAK